MRYMIRRNNPYRNALFTRMMSDFFEDDGEALPSGFPLDVVESDAEFTVKANLAGFAPEKLEITYDNNSLTIKGEVDEDNIDEKDGKYHVRERRFGSFARSITMPELIDADKINASSDNGVLIVHLPKKPETQPRKIQIQAHTEKSGKKVIDAGK